MSSSEFVNSVASKKEESVMNDATSRNAIYINNISKCYEIYEKPHDRLRQFVLPKLQGLVGKTPKNSARESQATEDKTFTARR